MNSALKLNRLSIVGTSLAAAGFVCALLAPGIANAQAAPAQNGSSMPGMDMKMGSDAGMGGMDHSQRGGSPTMPTMEGMDHGSKTSADAPSTPGNAGMSDMQGMDHSKMQGMPSMGEGKVEGMAPMAKEDAGTMPAMDAKSMMKSMQGGSPPDDARDPDAYADGLPLSMMPGMDMADDAPRAKLLVDRLEAFHSRDGNGQALDAQAWFGGDINKLWLKADGERSNGRLGATRTEALWDHAIAPYWGLQTGVRHDFGGGPARTWGAFGVQGLAPYWFDVQATAYVGQSGRTALRFEGEYDLLFTQRLILQPNVKANFYGRRDRERELGSGLSDIEAGLRLRYEITRKVAPYIGLVWNKKFSDTARFAREVGNPARETRVVAGVRLWF